MTHLLQTATWTPILPGAWREEARRALTAITEDLLACEHHEDPTLGSGTAGLSVSLAHLVSSSSDPRLTDQAMAWLDHAVAHLGSTHYPASLLSGGLGVAWAVAHLEGFFFDAEEDLNADFDLQVAEALPHLARTFDYDLVTGLSGIGIYALERGPRGHHLLARVVDHLHDLATPESPGLTWFTPPNRVTPSLLREAPEGYTNLGLAHGMPGPIALLARTVEAGVALERALPLLEGAVAWLMAQEDPQGASSFPNAVGPGLQPTSSRIAWCYGDLGISIALLSAGRRVTRPAWCDAALRIARRAANRTGADAGVKDAGFCHGAAGSAHLFNRLSQATGDALLQEAALHWLRITLDLRRPGEGIGGYAPWRPKPSPEVPAPHHPGLLEGAAGVALVLQAAMHDQEPIWDRALAVDLPVTAP
jgi:hypothetical protein